MNTERNELLNQLFEQHYQDIYKRCLWVVGFDPKYHHLIEDCIQEAFTKATDRYNDYKDYENPVGWIVRTACNTLRSELRRELKQRRTFLELPPDQLEMAAAEPAAADSLFDRQEMIRQLTLIYHLLTEREKLIFHEFFIERKHMREIAQDNDLGLGAVRSGIKRIRRRARATRHLGVILFLLGLYRFWNIG